MLCRKPLDVLRRYKHHRFCSLEHEAGFERSLLDRLTGTRVFKRLQAPTLVTEIVAGNKRLVGERAAAGLRLA
ncbi:MAG: hypothetical protein HYS04_11765 [Acidobacteria bacterium]|nr:hypothetical protein [Acidobacteriota bacterium]